MASTRDLESQAENDRSEIAATLDELRSRMSTGQIVDQAIAYARGHGGAEFVRNLGGQVKTNPLPVALVAAGLGWLMAGQRRPAARAYSPSIVPGDEAYYDNRYADRARETSSEVAGALRDSTHGAFGGARDSVEDATSSASDAFASARDRAQDAAASARDSVSSAYGAAAGAVGRATSAGGDTAAAIRRRAHDMRDLASDVGRGTAERARQAGHGIAEQAGRAQNAFSQLIREQPLVAGAIGLAIGAIIGASLPRSRREDKVMGEAQGDGERRRTRAVRASRGCGRAHRREGARRSGRAGTDLGFRAIARARHRRKGLRRRRCGQRERRRRAEIGQGESRRRDDRRNREDGRVARQA
ncbi:MAG TPA: DUF3618 domain-containing protein [Rhodoplanes sp.]|nr:DUF3618 domain-containing protein [Rhodoplanes sp.]